MSVPQQLVGELESRLWSVYHSRWTKVDEWAKRDEILVKQRFRSGSLILARRKMLAVVVVLLLLGFSSAAGIISHLHHGTENSANWWDLWKRRLTICSCSAITSIVVYILAVRFEEVKDILGLTNMLGVLECVATDLVVSSSIRIRLAIC